MATLTGACKVALGADIMGCLSNETQLVQKLEKLSIQRGDPCWRLPLMRPYRELLSSQVADISNAASGGYGGTITAGLFLQEFIHEKQSWAHLDIYAWKNSASGAWREMGGSGQAVQTLIAFLQA